MGRARWQIAVVCAGVLCCGRSAEQPSQSGGPPAATYRLAVSSRGAGTVTSAPAGIDCGTTCVADFPAGTNLFLSATPMSGSFFAGWGTACSGHGQCPLLMTHDAPLEASFETMPPS